MSNESDQPTSSSSAPKLSISAVLVTRGDVDLSPILETLPYDDIVIWDDSVRGDRLYGRYVGIQEAKHEIIYVQDDDLLFTEHDKLAEAYRPGRAVFNCEPGKDIPWCARGALFHRDLPAQVFQQYFDAYGKDELFTHHGCDMVFGLLGPVDRVWFGSVDLDYCEAPGRVSTSPGWWGGRRDEMQRRCEALGARKRSRRRDG